MNCKIYLCLLIILPAAITQKHSEILQSIEDITAENEKYQYPKNYNEFDKSPFIDAGIYGVYDFIIIGAGSAGTLLANRLSEVPEWDILLLEAGGDDDIVTDIPGMAGKTQYSKHNWGYQTVPQKYACLGMNNQQCNVPRGKVLGGSSTINFMIYTRGNKADYDKWEADGNPGWSYDEVLPYFIKMENSSLTENVDDAYHSNYGTLGVEHVRNFGQLGQSFLDGEVELGRKILDYNGEQQIGVSRMQSTLINGRRCSGNKAFLKPVLDRKNLSVVKGAFVTKIGMEDKKALGVEFLLGNEKYLALSVKETILSAGAVGSPQILIHSGIGPEEDLNNLGIDLVADLPVGKNLHDHPTLPFPFATNFIEPAFKPLAEMVSDYLNGSGFLTTPANMQTIGFINVENKTSSLPDLEIFLSAFFELGKGGLQIMCNYNDELAESYVKPYGDTSAIYFQYLAHQKSRGSVKLKSRNIFDHPLIDLNFFEDPEDVRIMIDGMRDFLNLLNTTAMKKMDAHFLHNPIPQCPEEFMSDDYLGCLIRHASFSLYHLSGTCKMGPESDPEAVVDSQLKVRGIENLRVVDASIIPFPLASHTNAPAFMIGEKAADMIKQKWRNDL